MRAVKRAHRRVATLAALTCAVAGCSGGVSGSGTENVSTVPLPASSTLVAPTVDAAIALSHLALGALQADSELAFFSLPVHLSPLANAGVAFAPACDAASASAQSVTAEPGGITVVRTAIYAPADTLCAGSPEAITVIGYTGAAAVYPRIGYGYEVSYGLSALTNLALNNGGTQSAIYVAQQDANTVDFVANLDVALPALASQPSAGTFPATFPALFPDASASIAAQAGDGLAFLAQGNYYATVASGTSLRAGWFPYFGDLTTDSPTGNTYAISDAATVQTAVASTGVTTLSLTDAAPVYAVSRSSQDPARLLSSFPLAGQQTRFSVGTSTVLGQVSAASNFGTPPLNTATIGSDGTISASHQHYIDSTNGVSVDVASSDGKTFTLAITDLSTKESLTNPTVLVLSTAGSGPHCTFSYTLFPYATGPRYSDELSGYYCPGTAAASLRKR